VYRHRVGVPRHQRALGERLVRRERAHSRAFVRHHRGDLAGLDLRDDETDFGKPAQLAGRERLLGPHASVLEGAALPAAS
jgi:hypothetical protein